MSTGIFNSGSWTPDLAQKSFSGWLTRYAPAGDASLFALTAMLKDVSILSWEHGYFAKTMIFPMLTLGAAALISDTELQVADSSNIVPGYVFRHDTTYENILVTAILSPTRVLVQRQVGTVAAQAMSNGDKLWHVGNAYEEASLRPNAMFNPASRYSNYTQIFRDAWAVSKTSAVMKAIAGSDSVSENRKDCMLMHASGIEKALWFGQKYLGSKNGQPLHLMEGIIPNITVNAPSNVVNINNADYSWTQLEAAIDPCFNQNTDQAEGNRRVAFVGGKAKTTITNICRKNSQMMITGEKTEWGLRIDTLKLSRGEVILIEHPMFNSNATWAKMGVVLDLASFGVGYLPGRKTTPSDFNVQGNQVDNGIDAVGGDLLTECTMELRNAAACSVLYNFGGAAVG